MKCKTIHFRVVTNEDFIINLQLQQAASYCSYVRTCSCNPQVYIAQQLANHSQSMCLSISQNNHQQDITWYGNCTKLAQPLIFMKLRRNNSKPCTPSPQQPIHEHNKQSLDEYTHYIEAHSQFHEDHPSLIKYNKYFCKCSVQTGHFEVSFSTCNS